MVGLWVLTCKGFIAWGFVSVLCTLGVSEQLQGIACRFLTLGVLRIEGLGVWGSGCRIQGLGV